jgi:hypothetical protein
MTVKRTKPVSLEELWEFEDRHPAVFASPRALAEARLIAALDGSKGKHRGHARGNGATHSRRRNGAMH